VGRPRPHITVVGLGPAGPSYLSTGVTDLAAASATVLLRTAVHPAAAVLGDVGSFDHLYESGRSFEEVYRAIVDAVVAAAEAQAPEPVLYAVPGSPLTIGRKSPSSPPSPFWIWPGSGWASTP
jgi:uncharacterized protein YabN with tetrapyrrole methylase and pyrophosphatase domain